MGEFRLKAIDLKLTHPKTLTFQSPCGEVVWERTYPYLRTSVEEEKFQSPCGEVVWESQMVKMVWVDGLPYRFNPLAGKSFGKEKENGKGRSGPPKFQSPCGEVVWERSGFA